MLTQEQVVGIGAETSNFEDLEHVEELAMYVSHNRNRRRDMYNIGLFHQHLFGFGAYCFNEGLGEELLLVQLGYAFI